MKAESIVSSSAMPEKVMSSSSSYKKKGEKSSTSAKGNSSNKIWIILRSLLIDIPLALVFLAYLLLFAIQTVHDTYYVPLMDRSTRTDLDLHQEFTYYHRHCTERDLTTRDMGDLLAMSPTSSSSANNATTTVSMSTAVSTTVAQLMQHGAVVIPQILSPETVRDLRDYAVYRNKVLKEEEAYPMSQGEGGTRRSFGYDATEHPALVKALREVTHHQHLKQTLAAVLGDDDPASSEITTITAYYGAIPQEWHSDTKEDGNALKYARTYSHSYSLFLPLQNITAAMGATDICVGTHYCANDLSSMCQRTKLGLHQSTPEGIFRAGDGALLNQHVWHRGGPHTDPDSMERIVFIVSFLARPKFRADTRQLSRGTYFHQKWNMWGHTWKDLTDPMRSMQYPFSLLRCLSLWKPPTYNWGYDLITSGFMRFSNEQMDLMDISDRLVPRFDDFHYPEWLRGPVLWTADDYRRRKQRGAPRKPMPTQKEALKAFVGGTIFKTHDFLRQAAMMTHAAYAALLLVVTLLWTMLRGKRQGRAVLGRAVFRLTISHSIVASIIFLALFKIQTSDWGHNVATGKALMRPFPPVRIASSEEMKFVSRGPTTYPGTFDVLMGTRFDVKWLGSYEQWLDYHPGNSVHLQHVMQKAPLVELYQHGRRVDGGLTHLPIVFAQRLLQETIDAVKDKRGRFLQQDYRTGDWLLMTKDEIESAVAMEMAWKRTPMHAEMEKVLNRWIAFYRFGVWRDSSLSRKSTVYLQQLKKILVGMNPSPPATLPLEASRHKPVTSAPLAKVHKPRFFSTRLTNTSDKKGGNSTGYNVQHVPPHIRFELPSKSAASNETRSLLREGDTIIAELADANGDVWWNRGHLIAFTAGGKCILSLENGLRVPNVPLSKVRLWEPIQEGDHVQGCFSDFYEDCFPGTVTRVMPDEAVRIVYDDGDIGHRVPPSEYYRPPYKPFPPEGY